MKVPLELRNNKNSKKLLIDEWFSEARQISCANIIVNMLKTGYNDDLPQIKFDPVKNSSPANGSVRSLATYVYRGEINDEYLSDSYIDKLLTTYDPFLLTVLCLLRLENILAFSKDLTLTKHEASELFCSCYILNKLIESNSGELTIWTSKVIDNLIDNKSKIYLAELFKACYLFNPYLITLNLGLPELINTIESRDKNSLETYFEDVNHWMNLALTL